MHDFKGHIRYVVKPFTISCLSGYDITPVKQRYKLCKWCVMAGGITREKQPIDNFPGKLFKGNYREY